MIIATGMNRLVLVRVRSLKGSPAAEEWCHTLAPEKAGINGKGGGVPCVRSRFSLPVLASREMRPVRVDLKYLCVSSSKVNLRQALLSRQELWQVGQHNIHVTCAYTCIGHRGRTDVHRSRTSLRQGEPFNSLQEGGLRRQARVCAR